MKFCYKGGEPDGLRQYRESHPGSRWEDFRRECQSGLAEVYEKLRQDQGELCVYCELKVAEANRQVEHFHDKSDANRTRQPQRNGISIGIICGMPVWVEPNAAIIPVNLCRRLRRIEVAVK